MAKQNKGIKVTVGQARHEQFKGDMLAVGLVADSQRLPKELANLDKAAGGAISGVLKLGDFAGKAGETAVLYVSGKTKCRRILLVGLGAKGKVDAACLRQAAGTAVRKVDKMNIGRLGLALHGRGGVKLDAELVGQAMSEGAIVGRYDYQDYLSVKKDDKAVGIMKVTIVEPSAAVGVKLNRGRRIGTILAEGQNLTRMVANKPGNEINPLSLGKEAQKLARQYGLRCKVFTDVQLKEMGMNAILAVGGGSVNKPRLIMLEHKGRKGRGGAKEGPDAVVVGKAVTFDSGGISIKPSANMEAMKFDKCGGCSVLGIMAAVAKLKLELNVVGLIPAAENMLSHTSYRPGDIIRTYSGKTVEVQNTDAEGRMILCDALAYAAKMKPKAIVDLATLTGSIVVALGTHKAGLFGNNKGLIGKLEKAADRCGEAVWTMPMGPEYLEQMKSKIADLKNIGDRYGGSSTAAVFLGEFVGDIAWAHIDIAGVADTGEEKTWRGVGATGYSVRLVTEYLSKSVDQ